MSALATTLPESINQKSIKEKTNSRKGSVTKRRRSRQSSLTNRGNNQNQGDLGTSCLTTILKHFTKEQFEAFCKALKFLDPDQSKRISCDEFVEALGIIGIPVNENIYSDLWAIQDVKTNGWYAFEQYLILMVDKDQIVSMMGDRTLDEEDVVMSEMISTFIKKNLLHEDQRAEMAKYYTQKLRKAAKNHTGVQTPEVLLRHYTDGARALGMTREETSKQIQALQELARNENFNKRRNSPYSLQNFSYKPTVRSAPVLGRTERQPSWNTRRSLSYDVRFPNIGMSNPLSYEHVGEIRWRVETAKDHYYGKLQKEKKKRFEDVWKDLYISYISTTRLQHIMKDIFSAYSANHFGGRREKYGSGFDLKKRPWTIGDTQSYLERSYLARSAAVKLTKSISPRKHSVA